MKVIVLMFEVLVSQGMIFKYRCALQFDSAESFAHLCSRLSKKSQSESFDHVHYEGKDNCMK